MKPLRVFWWAPMRSPRLLKPELQSNLGAWAHLGVNTRRPFLNFGDEMSPLIIEKVSGRRVVWAPPRAAEVVSVGSVFELAAKHSSFASVWGTGLRAEPDRATALRYKENLGTILAVRGPKTRSALSLTDETALGDPGLLADRLVTREVPRSDQRIFVPHFTTWNSRGGRRLLAKASQAGFKIVPPSLHPMIAMKAISQASFVISSSLHGVIVAHSLGVPVRLLEVGGRPGSEPDWKFMDYFASIDAGYESESWSIFDRPAVLAQSIDVAYANAARIRESAGNLGSRLVEVLQHATR